MRIKKIGLKKGTIYFNHNQRDRYIWLRNRLNYISNSALFEALIEEFIDNEKEGVDVSWICLLPNRKKTGRAKVKTREIRIGRVKKHFSFNMKQYNRFVWLKNKLHLNSVGLVELLITEFMEEENKGINHKWAKVISEFKYKTWRFTDMQAERLRFLAKTTNHTYGEVITLLINEYVFIQKRID